MLDRRSELNASIANIPLPQRMRQLPISDTGFPVPWFVAWKDGKPVMHLADPQKLHNAVAQERCWCCGERLGRYKAFVLGPMCVINQTTGEPPVHVECAEYAVKACPFLVNPRAKRNPTIGEEERQAPPGNAIMRNPGAMAIWVTRDFKIERVDDGILFRPGGPVSVRYFAHGRPATRDEVLMAFESGFPELVKLAKTEGEAAVEYLRKRMKWAENTLPNDPQR